MSIYHPIAGIVIKSYQGVQTQLVRELGELKNMQNSHSKNEEFAFKSMSKICNKVSGTLLTNIKGCNIVFNIFDQSLQAKVQSTNRENCNFRLIFTPIDGYLSYVRGLGNFASSFVLQKKTEDSQTESGFKNVFSLIFTQCDGYDFIVYTQNNTDEMNWVYVNEKMIKPNFKPSFSVSSLALSRFVACGALNNHPRKDFIEKSINSAQNIQINDSNAYIASLICSGFIDGLILANKKPIDLLASFMVLKNIGFETNLTEGDFVDILSEKTLDFFALSSQCYNKMFGR